MPSFDQIKIIDNHSHPFVPEREGEDFAAVWSTSLMPNAPAVNRQTLTYKMMLTALKPLLGLAADSTEEAVLTRRTELYQGDPRAYIEKLFTDAGLETIFADMGYPTEVFSGYSIDFGEYSALLPTRARAVIRIEPLAFELIGSSPDLAAFLQAFDDRLEADIVQLKPVALKTIAAYLTGLDLARPTEAEIEAAHRAFKADPNNLAAARPLLVQLVYLTVTKCLEHGLPLQMHTGFGNAPLLNVRQSNPSLLYGFLNDPEVGRLNLVLLHAGYPYVREMAYLANNYPNIWVDISQVTQFTSVGLDAVLTDLLAMVPTNKLMYGSDGLGLPELFWWPAKQIRCCLPLTLGRFVDQGFISEEMADEIGQGILRDNALAFYNLG